MMQQQVRFLLLFERTDTYFPVAIDYSVLNIVDSIDAKKNVIFFSSGFQGTSASLVEFTQHKDSVDIKVLAKSSREKIGGYPLDQTFIKYLADKFDTEVLGGGQSVQASPKHMLKLWREAKTMKEDCLSPSNICDIEMEEFYKVLISKW
jgi:molecular chaperone DnaK (HSP70)